MESSGRNISLWVDKGEFDLIDEACEYGADAYHILDEVKREKSKYKFVFSYEELDDLVCFLASDANPEESTERQRKLNALCGSIFSGASSRRSSNGPDKTKLFREMFSHGFCVLLALCGIGDFDRKPFYLKCLSSWVT